MVSTRIPLTVVLDTLYSTQMCSILLIAVDISASSYLGANRASRGICHKLHGVSNTFFVEIGLSCHQNIH